MYLKDFEIRWSDIDANRHLANSAYVNFMSHTRVAFFEDHDFALAKLVKHQIGPVVFYEHIYYFKEAFLGTPIRVSLEIKGMSADGMFFMIEHNIYNGKGEHLATCELLGAWINLETRALTPLPDVFLEVMEAFPRAADFKVLTKADTRKHGKKPSPLKF